MNEIFNSSTRDNYKYDGVYKFKMVNTQGYELTWTQTGNPFDHTDEVPGTVSDISAVNFELPTTQHDEKGNFDGLHISGEQQYAILEGATGHWSRYIIGQSTLVSDKILTMVTTNENSILADWVELYAYVSDSGSGDSGSGDSGSGSGSSGLTAAEWNAQYGTTVFTTTDGVLDNSALFAGVTAKNIKLNIQSWNSWISMNWGVYIDDVLDNPADDPAYREYSSQYNHNTGESSLGSGVGWAASTRNMNQWAMIKYSTPQTFTGLKMVEREDTPTQYVKTFTLEFSD